MSSSIDKHILKGEIDFLKELKTLFKKYEITVRIDTTPDAEQVNLEGTTWAGYYFVSSFVSYDDAEDIRKKIERAEEQLAQMLDNRK